MTKPRSDIIYLPVFFALTGIYFSDVFFKGLVLAVGDGFDYSYPMMVAMSRQYRDLIFPFWDPYQFSGFPLFASLTPGALYPFNIVLPLLFKPTTAFNLNVMLHYALAGFFTFLYARQINLGVFASLVAGTVYSLLGYLPSHLQHVMLLLPAAWIPLIFYLFERLRQNPGWKNAGYLALIIALQFLTGNLQVCFYTYIVLFFYFLLHVFRLHASGRLRFALLTAFSLAGGWLIALPQLIATYELSELSSITHLAAYEFFSSFAFPLHMIPTFLFPFFYYYGGSYNGDYWGPTPELGQEAFVGTMPFLLALIVMTRWKKNSYIMFWGGMAILAFVLALGDAVRPLNKLLFHLPVYNVFRASSKHILEMSFALSILAGFGISFLQEGEKEKRFSAALVVVLSIVVVTSLILFTFFPDAVRAVVQDGFYQMRHFQLRWERGAIPEGALRITDPAIYVPLIAMSAGLFCTLILLKVKRKYLRNAALAAVFIIIFAEAALYKMGPLRDVAAVENYNKGLYEVMLSSGNRGRTIFMSNRMLPLNAVTYGIRLVEGYHPLQPAAYQKMLPEMYTQPPAVWRSYIMNNSLLSMLNVTYLVVEDIAGNLEDIRWPIGRDDEGRPFPVLPSERGPDTGAGQPVYRLLASFGSYSVYENMISLPRVYSVDRLRPADTVEEFMRGMVSYDMNPWLEAAVSAGELQEIGGEGFFPGKLTIMEDRPDRIGISSNFRGRGFVVLADQFYPGWEAYIDGMKTKIYKTNGVLRGVVVPEGEHLLVFRYVPRIVYASMAASAFLLVALAFVLLKDRFRRKRDRGATGDAHVT